MSNLMKMLIIFFAMLLLVGGILVVVANWTGHPELLPPFLQDEAVVEQAE